MGCTKLLKYKVDNTLKFNKFLIAEFWCWTFSSAKKDQFQHIDVYNSEKFSRVNRSR